VWGHLTRRVPRILEGTFHNTGLAWKQKLMKYAPSLWFEHLQECLLEAEANRDAERAKAIRTMMTREESATMWQRLSFTFADNGG
jgi:hypothetical protein